MGETTHFTVLEVKSCMNVTATQETTSTPNASATFTGGNNCSEAFGLAETFTTTSSTDVLFADPLDPRK